MWGNFRDVRSTMERLSQVVAPPVATEHDDEEDEEDDDEYEEEYEEDEYDDEEENAAIRPTTTRTTTTTSSGGFGFVGLLTRALDSEQAKHQQQEETHPQQLAASLESDNNNNYYYQEEDTEEEIIELMGSSGFEGSSSIPDGPAFDHDPEDSFADVDMDAITSTYPTTTTKNATTTTAGSSNSLQDADDTEVSHSTFFHPTGSTTAATAFATDSGSHDSEDDTETETQQQQQDDGGETTGKLHSLTTAVAAAFAAPKRHTGLRRESGSLAPSTSRSNSYNWDDVPTTTTTTNNPVTTTAAAATTITTTTITTATLSADEEDNIMAASPRRGIVSFPSAVGKASFSSGGLGMPGSSSNSFTAAAAAANPKSPTHVNVTSTTSKRPLSSPTNAATATTNATTNISPTKSDHEEEGYVSIKIKTADPSLYETSSAPVSLSGAQQPLEMLHPAAPQYNTVVPTTSSNDYDATLEHLEPTSLITPNNSNHVSSSLQAQVPAITEDIPSTETTVATFTEQSKISDNVSATIFQNKNGDQGGTPSNEKLSNMEQTESPSFSNDDYNNVKGKSLSEVPPKEQQPTSDPTSKSSSKQPQLLSNGDKLVSVAIGSESFNSASPDNAAIDEKPIDGFATPSHAKEKAHSKSAVAAVPDEDGTTSSRNVTTTPSPTQEDKVLVFNHEDITPLITNLSPRMDRIKSLPPMPTAEESDDGRSGFTPSVLLDKTKQRPVVVQLQEEMQQQPFVETNNRNHKGKQQQQHESSNFHEDAARVEAMEKRCHSLENQLRQAESQIIELQTERARQMEREEELQQQLIHRFSQKEARLLEAAQEDHQQELAELRSEMEARFLALQQGFEQERADTQRELEQYERLLEETQERLENVEREKQTALSKNESVMMQQQQRQERALRNAEEKLALTMAQLDERDIQVAQLKSMIQTLQSKMSEHQHGAQEAEEELDEIHAENEQLRSHVEKLEMQCADLRSKVDKLSADSEKLTGLKMELRMLKEDRERERAKSQSVVASAESSTVKLEEERDAALSEVRDLTQQLAAVLADLEVARSDTQRVMTANQNLQRALEAFQNEREAELAMLEEQQRAIEEATAAAHAAALEATHEANDARIREIQFEADEKVKVSKEEIRKLEGKLEKFRVENVQMRRSLDEAISRLQTTQEDVIDRTLMKNILLDWLSKTNNKEKRQVLEVMASVLHFTEDEKEKVHIGDTGGLSRIVGAVAAPLPPSKADLQHLQGDGVREKWINFLLAETDD